MKSFLECSCRSDSTSSVLMNAAFFLASCDHEFTERQFDHRNVAACTVNLAHTERRGQTPAVNLSVHLIKQARGSLGIRVQSASALCLCMPRSVGIPPPTAGSCSISLAHISAPAPPHAVHVSYQLPSHLPRPQDPPPGLPQQTRAQRSYWLAVKGMTS